MKSLETSCVTEYVVARTPSQIAAPRCTGDGSHISQQHLKPVEGMTA